MRALFFFCLPRRRHDIFILPPCSLRFDTSSSFFLPPAMPLLRGAYRLLCLLCPGRRHAASAVMFVIFPLCCCLCFELLMLQYAAVDASRRHLLISPPSHAMPLAACHAITPPAVTAVAFFFSAHFARRYVATRVLSCEAPALHYALLLLTRALP